ncbi:MAG: hypothetical protein JWP78_2034 [Mucilaginibacter sp.]|nr:hypothetical protein [Mucilaginibacter sp.]
MNALKPENKFKGWQMGLLDGIFQFIAFGLVIIGLGLVICVFNHQPIKTTLPIKPPASSKATPTKKMAVTETASDQNDHIKDYWTIISS